jgi:predicted ribosome quality control (RQC) complex YloA/Tae2 family protein
MNESVLKAITEELETFLKGRKLGKIFQISSLSFVFDFNLSRDQYLFVSVEPNLPRIYLMKRKLKELEKTCLSPSNFFLFIRKKLAGAIVEEISKLEEERIIRISLISNFETEERYSLIVQLTGRSANLFLLDSNDIILVSLRESKGEGQIPGTKFTSPQKPEKEFSQKLQLPKSKNHLETLSEALDKLYQEIEAERLFQELAKKAKAILKKRLTKASSKFSKLQQELESLKEAFLWKRYGDLIIANLNQIVEVDGKFLVIDYFDENMPTVEIDAEENLTPKELAEKFFKKYSKAKRANEEIRKQLQILESEITQLKALETEIEKAINQRDEEFLRKFLGENEVAKNKQIATTRKSSSKKKDEISVFARRFVSSDGLEILVGKGAKENDYLTFRFAKSLDFWLHTADYAGSHVIVRNPNRLEALPHRTLIEAAEIAAFFSQAKKHPKVAVNYTQRKFVHKPRSASPGLVSLSKFKTIIVEPKIGVPKQEFPSV